VSARSPLLMSRTKLRRRPLEKLDPTASRLLTQVGGDRRTSMGPGAVPEPSCSPGDLLGCGQWVCPESVLRSLEGPLHGFRTALSSITRSWS
jgi:hypothetical protein